MARAAAKPAARRRRLSSDARRELILEGATRVFAERGYRDASMAEIARAAGITPAVIYDHFESKAELHITLLERETQQMMAQVGAALAEAPAELRPRFRAAIDAFFRFVEEHEFAWRLMFRDANTDPRISDAYRELGGDVTGAVTEFIRSSAPAAMLDDPDSDERIETFAKLLTSAQTGLAFWWYANRHVPREVVVDRVVDFFWLGMERVTAGERSNPA
ncbi:MAG TPA: TetR/AcrR family transcriptional regulator [Thermoleophilaceae bacterium]|nr:TetR/AcrR family transcriptional regulator [Thermoleophilaceae bacterium]